MASELANKIYKGINEKYCKRKLSILSLVLIDEIIKENAAQQQLAANVCCNCGHEVQFVRPGKWQCNNCDARERSIE